MSKLSYKDFDFLKESLTMILDESFIPLIQNPDKGYQIHKQLRDKLTEFWKETKDFDKLVTYGLKELPNYLSKTN